MGPLALAALLLATSARAQFDPACAGWRGSTEPMPLSRCNPLPQAALDYAKRCLEVFKSKLDDRYVVIGNYHGVSGEFSRLYVLKWNKQDPSESIVLLRGGLGQGAGNKTVDRRKAGVTTDARDAWDSNSSPGGCMRLYGSGGAGVMPTYPEYQGFKLEGLEERNACVLTRGIHFHESDRVNTRRTDPNADAGRMYADFRDVRLDENLTTGQSPGCFNVATEDYAWIKKAGVVGRKGTLFLSFDGCLDDIEPRRNDRRCKDPSDVRDCRTRSAPAASIPQMMVEQNQRDKRTGKTKNERQLDDIMQWADGLKRGVESK